jgi:DHA1 family bicyclomycin/chloramphenicol resistance-like MFS transporter
MPFSNSNLPASGPRPGSREIVALLAGLMALNAFAIDAMIPALPAIGADLHVVTENNRQLVVLTYFLGFGVGQIFWGLWGRGELPAADRRANRNGRVGGGHAGIGRGDGPRPFRR